MSARFPVRSATLILGAILAVTMAAEAQADHRQRRRVIIQEQVYAPGFFERIPGVRTLFGDYALTEEEYNALYGPGRRDFDESYYEPEPTAPKPKLKTKPAAKQGAKPSATKPAAKSATAARPAAKSKDDTPTASITPKSDSEAPAAKTASAAPAKGITCEKATGIVSGFGFTAVTPQSCSGKVYAFNATRGGKTFAVKVDPASGELTEVKKLE